MIHQIQRHQRIWRISTMSDKGNYPIPLQLMIESYIYKSCTQRYHWWTNCHAIADGKIFI